MTDWSLYRDNLGKLVNIFLNRKPDKQKQNTQQNYYAITITIIARLSNVSQGKMSCLNIEEARDYRIYSIDGSTMDPSINK